MQYIPHHKMNGRSHLMIDGAAIEGTALTLSHWPHSGTPWPLKGDLSAEIVFNYLKQPEFHIQAEAATNTHYDVDGLVGVWTAINPDDALKNEALLVQIAKAGDFADFEDWKAYRIRCALDAHTDPKRSPLDKAIFEAQGADYGGNLYTAMLEVLPQIMADPGKYKWAWEKQEEALSQAEDWIKSGKINIREDKDLDLAVVECPEGVTESQVPGEAVHRTTDRMAILLRGSDFFKFYYRYETWVQYVSRPLRWRVDLRPLAKELTTMEQGGGVWDSPDPADLVLPLTYHGKQPSTLNGDEFEKRLRQALAGNFNPFNPMDPK